MDMADPLDEVAVVEQTVVEQTVVDRTERLAGAPTEHARLPAVFEVPTLGVVTC